MTFDPNAQDLGGPGGRQGSISDANPPALQNPNEGRSRSDYGTRPQNENVFKPESLLADTDGSFTTRLFEILSETDELLVVQEVKLTLSGEEIIDNRQVVLAKPIPFRKSTYDTDGEENDDGIIITHVKAGERQLVITDENIGTRTYNEVITPPYKTGDRIFAVEVGYSGVGSVHLQAQNLEGRKWDYKDPPYQWFVVDDVEKEGYDCYVWDWSAGEAIIPEDGSRIKVAKPIDIRGSFWNGKSIAGVDYTVQGGSGEGDNFDTRLAEGSALPAEDEVQDITPVWRQAVSGDITIILAAFLPQGTGTGRNGVHYIWQDLNQGARAFALRFE